MQIALDPLAKPTSDLAALVIVVGLLFGVLSVAAVASIREDCKTDTAYLITESGAFLVTESGERLIVDETRKCDLVAGPFRMPMWRW
jgi:hypothetical protein